MFMSKGQMIIVIKIVYSNFNYCPLVWQFWSSENQRKLNEFRYALEVCSSKKISAPTTPFRLKVKILQWALRDWELKYHKNLFVTKWNARVKPNNILFRKYKSVTDKKRSLDMRSKIMENTATKHKNNDTTQ